MHRCLAIAAALAAGAGVTGLANAQLVNGNFEIPLVDLGGSPDVNTTFAAGSTIGSGWSVLTTGTIGGAGEPVPSDPADRNVTLFTSAGFIKQGAVTTRNWVDLTGERPPGNGFSGNGVTQTFGLTPGVYTLSFYVGSLYNGAGFTHDAVVQLTINGVVVPGSFLTPGSLATSDLRTYWQLHSHTFAAQAVNSIEFRAVHPTGWPGAMGFVGLDDVTVTAIPEPMAYLLALGGIGIVAAAARRRRQRS